MCHLTQTQQSSLPYKILVFTQKQQEDFDTGQRRLPQHRQGDGSAPRTPPVAHREENCLRTRKRRRMGELTLFMPEITVRLTRESSTLQLLFLCGQYLDRSRW